MSDSTTNNDLIISLPKNITAETFTDEAEFDKLFSQILGAVNSHVPDTTTRKGRDAIGSLARKVSSTKVVLDNAGKALTEEWRDKTKAVNDARNRIKQKLDDLRDDVRKPLTEWEDAEKARVDKHEAGLARLQQIAGTGYGVPSGDLKALKAELGAMPIDADAWEEFHGRACIMHAAAADTIDRLIVAAEKHDAEQAELEALRREKEERDRIDREKAELERLDREAKEREERERLAEEQRQRDIAEAEIRAREKAEADAKAAVERAEREKREAIEKAEREKQEAVAAAERAENERRQREENERRRREADEANRKAVFEAVEDDLVHVAQLAPEAAAIVAQAISTGRIRHVSIEF